MFLFNGWIYLYTIKISINLYFLFSTVFINKIFDII